MGQNIVSGLPNRRMIGVGEVAEMAGCCKHSVYRAVRDKRFVGPSRRFGKKWLWEREVVLAALGLNASATGAK